MNGITRVTLKKAKSILLVISKPDVYKSPAGDTFIIFGEAKLEDLSNQAVAKAAEQFGAADAAAPDADADAAPAADAAVVEAASDEAVDETGIEQKDIDLVVSQTNCSRAKAVAALKESGGDIVNAIMELTM